MKNVKKDEYVHLLRKDRELKESDPGKQMRFSLRGQEVKRAKLDRFEAEHPHFKPSRPCKFKR